MFNFRQKKYRTAVYKSIMDMVYSCHEDRFGHVVASFGAFNNSLESRGIISIKNILSLFMKNGLSVQESALSLIDGTVTNINAALGAANTVTAENQDYETGSLKELKTDLEKIIDYEMRQNPGRIIPKNGTFGKAAAAVGLNRFE